MSPNKILKKTAIVYCRTSTAGQKDAATIDAQIERCARLVEQHDLTLLRYGPNNDGWIRDNGITGSLLEGRAFATLVDDLEEGRLRVDYLVVYSMSRLARHDKSSKDMRKLVKSATDKARIMAVLNGAGVQIIDQDGVNDPASVLTEIKETLSGEEYRHIRIKTMDGKRRVLSTGAWATGGRVPFGYVRVSVNGKDKKQGTTLAPSDVDGPRLRSLLEWFIQGGVSEAARRATAAGWPAPRGGKTWYPSAIQQILENIRAYLGETTLTIDGQPFEIRYPALIDPLVLAAVERRRKERTLKQRTVLLSTGFVDCACGRHIHGHRSGRTGPYYAVCRGRCGTLREDKLSAQLWEAVVARLVQIKQRESISTPGTDVQVEAIDRTKAELANVQASIDRLLTLYGDGDIDKQALTVANDKYRSRKLALQAEVARLERERDEKRRRRQREHSVQDRVQLTLRALKVGRVSLDIKRKILGDLLQGERVVLTHRVDAGSVASTLTFPAFGALPPLVVGLNRDITTQVHGVNRELLDVCYETEDVIEEVTM